MTEDSPNADRYMVLLEQIQSHLQIVAEEQVQLRVDMNWGFKSLRNELKTNIAVLNLAIKKNSQKLDRLGSKLERMIDKVETHDKQLSRLPTRH